jgi:hypothetical protein
MPTQNEETQCGVPSGRVCKALEELTGKYKVLLSAFPNDDPKGHHDAHQKMIDAAIAQERFWSELRLELAKKGAVALMFLLLSLIAAGFTLKLLTVLGIYKAGGG